jgi:D-arabinose 1-dehydrogenase-like Zn-dependent alcohol dehydrogenase
VKDVTNGRGIDVYYELVDTIATLKAGVDCLGIGGRVMVIGYKAEQNINFYLVDLLVKEGQVLTSVAGCKRDLEVALHFGNQRKANPIITNKIKLEESNDAIDPIINQKIKGRSVIAMD